MVLKIEKDIKYPLIWPQRYKKMRKLQNVSAFFYDDKSVFSDVVLNGLFWIRNGQDHGHHQSRQDHHQGSRLGSQDLQPRYEYSACHLHDKL